MKHKKTFVIGMVMVSVGLLLSFRDYNVGTFSTVHHYAIFCHLQTPHFVEVYGTSLRAWDHCIHNTAVAAILYGILGIGAFLIYKSKIKS